MLSSYLESASGNVCDDADACGGDGAHDARGVRDGGAHVRSDACANAPTQSLHLRAYAFLDGCATPRSTDRQVRCSRRDCPDPPTCARSNEPASPYLAVRTVGATRGRPVPAVSCGESTACPWRVEPPHPRRPSHRS